MYQRLSAVLFPIVTLFFIGTALWGYQEHQEKNRILVKAENQYQRAFHDLSYHMDRLHEELGNTLAVSSNANMHRKGLINMWRLTSEAQSEVNQLPLTLMPFHETEELLANIANFSYKTVLRDWNKQPLTDTEKKTLKTLYERSKEISGDLRKVQDSVINKRLQWMDVEMLLASGKENFDNDIVDGFKLMNKRVAEYGDIDWGPAVTAMNERRVLKKIDGPPITPEEAKKKAAKFLNISDTSSMQVVENGTDTEFTTYSVNVPVGKQASIQLEYTKAGGKLVYFLSSEDVKASKINVDQAVEAGRAFLEKYEYGPMRAISFDSYNHVASIIFARVVNGVTIYPEKVTVRVSMEDAKVLGLSAGDMLQTGITAEVKEPALTVEEVRKNLNPEFKEQDVSLAVIRNDLEEAVLCYEFLGRINGGTYRIFLNADNGFEEKIERLRQADAESSK